MKARAFKTSSRTFGEIDLSDALNRYKVWDTIQLVYVLSSVKVELLDIRTTGLNAVSTVPAHETWDLYFIQAAISSSAAVGARSGLLSVLPSIAGFPGARARNTVDIIAGQLGSIAIDPTTGKEFVIENGAVAAETTTVFNKHLVSGDAIRFVITGLDAADTVEMLAYIRRNPV